LGPTPTPTPISIINKILINKKSIKNKIILNEL
jgi:hypothetical protein